MIDFKNYERLTISKGEIRFYEDAYNKCSNHNAPEIREKINNGTLVCDIEGYQYCSYSSKELSDMYSRLAKLEDMIEQGKLVEKIDTKTTLTNREWLNNLSNEQLVEFIYGELPYIARQYAQSYTGVIQWLNEEHKE